MIFKGIAVDACQTAGCHGGEIHSRRVGGTEETNPGRALLNAC